MYHDIETLLKNCFPKENSLLIAQVANNVVDLLRAQNTLVGRTVVQEDTIHCQESAAEVNVLYFL